MMEILCPKEQTFHLSPNNYLAELNNSCLICKSKIKYYESISICYCYLFTHRDCYLSKIKPYVKPKRKYLCLYCGHQIQLSVKTSCKIQCRVDSRQLLAYAICIIALIVTLVLTKLGYYRVLLSDFTLYGVVAVLFTLLVVAILNSILVMEVVDLEVKQTKLEERNVNVDIDFVESKMGEEEQGTNVEMLIPDSRR